MVKSPQVARLTMPLDHPGETAEERRTSLSTSTLSRRVTLPVGMRLIDAMTDVLDGLGASCGQVELLDGFMSQIDYCYPALCQDGSAAVTYSQSHEALVPARVIAGSATVGFRQNERFAHCHATWFDANGEVRGGHLWPTTTIGPSPIRAVVHALDDVELISDIDAECRLPVFVPQRCQSRGLTQSSESKRAVMARLAPGAIVDTVVQDIMDEQGFDRASIAGSLGSFVGAAFHRGNNVLIIDGPATEVTLTGEFDLRDRQSPSSRLSGMVIDRQGAVHAGEFVKSESMVACTLELLVREIT